MEVAGYFFSICQIKFCFVQKAKSLTLEIMPSLHSYPGIPLTSWILLSAGKTASLPSISMLTPYEWSWQCITSLTMFQARQKLAIGQITFLSSTVSLPVPL